MLHQLYLFHLYRPHLVLAPSKIPGRPICKNVLKDVELPRMSSFQGASAWLIQPIQKNNEEPLLFQVSCTVRRKMALVHVQGNLNMHSWLHCSSSFRSKAHFLSRCKVCGPASTFKAFLPCPPCHRTSRVRNCPPHSPIIPAPTTESIQHLSQQNWQNIEKLPAM